MKFSQITNSIKYFPKHKSLTQKYHSEFIDYYMENGKPTKKYRKSIIDEMNYIGNCIKNGDVIPEDWTVAYALSLDVDDSNIDDEYRKSQQYINYDDIEWDVAPNDSQAPITPKMSTIPAKVAKKPPVVAHTQSPVQPVVVPAKTIQASAKRTTPTPKEDLYLKPAAVPLFDNKGTPWMDVIRNGRRYTIYKTIPEIPETLNDITITTDSSKMVKSDFMKLFPNHLIHTRSPIMYEPVDKCEYDSDLGVIFPISGFTTAQIRDNIIKYPHLYKLLREDGSSFYSHIEIGGVLYDISEVWDSFPESAVIPKHKDFIKEYVVRRYLLERDINKIEHVSKMLGELEPFLTLFNTATAYKKYGYSDSESIARMCVESRISYWRSRNPILRLLSDKTDNAEIEYSANSCINCIYASRCTQLRCDYSCPILAEVDYLLERNGIVPSTNIVFSTSKTEMQKYYEMLHKSLDKPLSCIITDDTIRIAQMITYCAICDTWKGSRLSCATYHLNFSNHIDSIQQSWGLKNVPDTLEYEQIWCQSAKILIISNLDFIQFKDFQTQTLLNMIHNRMINNLPTIVISPRINTLVGQGPFFAKLQTMLEGGAVE